MLEIAHMVPPDGSDRKVAVGGKDVPLDRRTVHPDCCKFATQLDKLAQMATRKGWLDRAGSIWHGLFTGSC